MVAEKRIAEKVPFLCMENSCNTRGDDSTERVIAAPRKLASPVPPN
jgi:hypothetical protein